MYLLYIDESGTKDLHRGENNKEGVLKTKDEIYKICFQHLLSSVNNFMNHEQIKESVTVFIDRIDSAHNKKVYIAYKEALGSQAIDFIGFDEEHFSPSINFVDSEFTIGVQIADIIAGALWRGVEKNKKRTRSYFSLDSLKIVMAST